MIGVILWSDSAEKKAVIWCEDHGDLAFLSRPDAVTLPDTFVDVGDVVEFDLKATRSTRVVQNVKVLSESRGGSLVEELKATPVETPSHTAAVIPFRIEPPMRRDASPSPKVQRRG